MLEEVEETITKEEAQQLREFKRFVDNTAYAVSRNIGYGDRRSHNEVLKEIMDKCLNHKYGHYMDSPGCYDLQSNRYTYSLKLRNYYEEFALYLG